MLRDDIITRQLKRLVAAIARLRAVKLESEAPLGETVDEEIERFTGLKGGTARRMGPAQLVDALSPGGVVRTDSAVACAHLMLELADQATADELRPAAALHLRRNAAALLLAVEHIDQGSEELEPWLAALDPLLKRLDVDAELEDQ